MQSSPILHSTNSIVNESTSLPIKISQIESTSVLKENHCDPDSHADSVSEVTPYPIETDFLEEITNKLKNITLVENLNNNPIQNLEINSKMTSTITTMDLIKIMKPFDGAPRTLNRFIRNADRIIATAQGNADLLTDLIRTKITDKANEILISVGDPNDWELIKTHLLTQFSDRRTVETILYKLNTISQGSKNLETYFAEISDLQTALLNSIDPGKPEEFRAGQTEVYLSIVLKSFIAGLDLKLGYIVRANKPENIKDAYDVCLNEMSMLQSNLDRNRLTQRQTHHQHTPQHTQQSKPLHFQNSFRTQPVHNSPMYKPTFQPPQINRPNPFNHSNHFRPLQTNRPFFGPTQTQQPFVNKPAFTPNQSYQPKPFYNPTPMDTSSGNTKQVLHNKPNIQFKPTGPPNFVSKELFNVGQEHNYDQEYYEEYSPYEYDTQEEDYSQQSDVHPENSTPDENFQSIASTLKPPDCSN